MFELVGASIELVRVHAGAYGAHNRTTALLDRETGPSSERDLTWPWTLAVVRVVCAALAGVFKKRKLNSITKINIRNLIELIK
jgi:hypothetical protein